MQEGKQKAKTHFSSCAALAAIDARIQEIGFLEPVRKTVHIRQNRSNTTRLKSSKMP